MAKKKKTEIEVMKEFCCDLAAFYSSLFDDKIRIEVMSGDGRYIQGAGNNWWEVQTFICDEPIYGVYHATSFDFAEARREIFAFTIALMRDCYGLKNVRI